MSIAHHCLFRHELRMAQTFCLVARLGDTMEVIPEVLTDWRENVEVRDFDMPFHVAHVFLQLANLSIQRITELHVFFLVRHLETHLVAFVAFFRTRLLGVFLTDAILACLHMSKHIAMALSINVGL